ncbi:spore coat protein [Bacillus luteolus]|uniref:Spore coat protein n=1 Tax=Litchfieldia luteola TaxID=682179 RepID=A0ABR9QLN6_9BACI|nr:CotY/CotZ family spore coat protein [Cytobacillus luteolus]MBE4909412.1 spore coat protein [Cytobacillus luteolus]MBP1940811.1 spore coat protein Y [Cytobacillus luteolus]
MSCSKRNCVCEAVEAILDAQDAVNDKCPTSCFQDLLNPAVAPGRDTIPFILFDKKGGLFKAFGNVGKRLPLGDEMDCFKTIFFRVENIKDDCCATLSLLRPENGDIKDPCDLGAEDRLFRTDFCIEVDLSCFCAIQCLSPDLVARRF